MAQQEHAEAEGAMTAEAAPQECSEGVDVGNFQDAGECGVRPFAPRDARLGVVTAR